MPATPLDDPLYSIEVDEDEGSEAAVAESDADAAAAAPPQELYVTLGKARGVRVLPLAFSVPDNLPPVVVDGFAVAWRREAVAAFRDMRGAVRAYDPSFVKNLPYASLRGLLEVGIDTVGRIEQSMSLDRYALEEAKMPAPFLHLFGRGGTTQDVEQQRQDVLTAFRPLLDVWINGFLVPSYVDPGQVPLDVIERLRDLWQDDALVDISPYRSQTLPWGQHASTGTAKPKDSNAFRMLADHAARLVAGHEVFAGRGAVRRIVTMRTASGRVELVTPPIDLSGKGPFSFVLTFEVVTFPSVHQPLLTLKLSKRLWLSHLAADARDRNAIGGLVFSSAHRDRAFSYRAVRRQGGMEPWATDNAFEAIRDRLQLPYQSFDASAIARGEASTNDCRVLLTLREGLQDRQHPHGIKRGVPEADKLEAIDAIAAILAPTGLRPFDGYRRVPGSHSDDDSATRDINAPTLLQAIIEGLESGDLSHRTPDYFAAIDDSAIDALLRRHLLRGLDVVRHGNKLVKHQNVVGRPVAHQAHELDVLIEANQRAVARLYPDERPLLMIFFEDGLTADLKLLQHVVKLLWGDAVELRANRLPAGTHGPWETLPGKGKKAAERSALRVQAWRSVAQQLAALGRRTFCLVLAREFYPAIDETGRPRHDDRVNKASTRKALASIGRACVQFLTPPSPAQRTGTIDIADFLHRVQAALRDLISAHSGRVDGVKAEVDRWLEAVPEGQRPRQIIGITIVRKNRGRARAGFSNTYLPIAIRIDVATGRCDMTCAYDGPGGQPLSPWQHFSDALATVSRVSPVRLADTQEAAKVRFMRFVDVVVSEAVDDGARPLVIIDSSNAVRLWPWLRDTDLDGDKIEINNRQWMEQTWKGARIVRIRQDLAPGIVEDKAKPLALSSVDDERRKADLAVDFMLPAPSSPTGLYRLNATKGTGCVAYLSVGRNSLVTKARGPSAYRETLVAVPVRVAGDGLDRAAPVTNAAGERLFTVAKRPPFTDQWPTPNPLEIVVALRQENDDPDSLALLVEALRHVLGHYGEWTALPAPLFFERVVRDYISGFALEDEDEETDTAEGSDEDSDDVEP
jgi:RNaseH domain of pPIWI_RE/pPIWI_RE module N-terminal domain/MID domain of pPIWI_RE